MHVSRVASPARQVSNQPSTKPTLQEFKDGKPLTGTALRKTTEFTQKEQTRNTLISDFTSETLTYTQKFNLKVMCEHMSILLQKEFCKSVTDEHLNRGIFSGMLGKSGSRRNLVGDNKTFNLKLDKLQNYLSKNVSEKFTLDNTYRLCILLTNKNESNNADNFTNSGTLFFRAIGITSDSKALKTTKSNIIQLGEDGIPKELKPTFLDNYEEEKKDSEPNQPKNPNSVNGIPVPPKPPAIPAPEVGLATPVKHYQSMGDMMATIQQENSKHNLRIVDVNKDKASQQKLTPEQINKLPPKERGKYLGLE